MNSEVFSRALRSLLQLGWVKVTFTKKDGSEREMLCTTNMENIPTEFHPINSKNVQNNKDEVEVDQLFSVYELDKGWRSFRTSQILKISMRKQ